MDLPTQDIDGFLGKLRDGCVGLEFRIERGKASLDLVEAADALIRVETCRASIVGTAVFAGWLSGEVELAEDGVIAAREFRQVLQVGSDLLRLRALTKLVRALDLSATASGVHSDVLRIAFAGAYLENPTALRVLAYGGVFSLALAVTALAGGQVKKEWDAETCRANAQGMARMQVDVLAELARREGRWSSRHAESHRLTMEAAQVASRACGSVLNTMELRMHLSPGIDFEIKLGPPPASSPAPWGR